MSSPVFMFPGQTSRYPEMIEKLAAYEAHCADILEKGSDVLSRDLVQHYSAANPAIFARNRDVQLGVFLANHMHLKLLERMGIRSDWSLGLSLGEYNHLVHIGALSFEDALVLLEQRCQLYEAGPAGVMDPCSPRSALHRLRIDRPHSPAAMRSHTTRRTGRAFLRRAFTGRPVTDRGPLGPCRSRPCRRSRRAGRPRGT